MKFCTKANRFATKANRAARYSMALRLKGLAVEKHLSRAKGPVSLSKPPKGLVSFSLVRKLLNQTVAQEWKVGAVYAE